MSNADKNKRVSATDISRVLRVNDQETPKYTAEPPVDVSDKEFTTTTAATSSNTTTVTSNGATIILPKKRIVKRKSQEERNLVNLEAALEEYATAGIGTVKKINALSLVLQYVKRQPKTSVLDKVYKFFVEHKNDAFLSPENALQRNVILDKEVNLQVRIFYKIMYSLAKGTATRRNTNLDTIRTVFKSDEISSWVADKIRMLHRSTRV